MVLDHTIPFGAPSQFRLHLVADGEGTALVAVLTGLNQPLGNLQRLVLPVSDLQAFAQGKLDNVVAQNAKATCTLKCADPSAQTIDVHYVDEPNWTDSWSYIRREELQELLQDAATPQA